jgi:two-component system, LytTR family, sensor kinase
MRQPNPDEDAISTPRINWFLIFGLWALYGFCFANQTFFDMQAQGMRHSYLRMVVYGLATGLVWAMISPAVFTITKHFPLERDGIAKSVGAHLVGLVWAILVSSAGIVALTMLIRPYEPLTSTAGFDVQFIGFLRARGPYAAFAYGMIVGIAHAIEYRHRALEREVEAAKLATLLAQAQVASLKMQLHPHFLFNTLNGIVSLVRNGERETAVSMLIGVSSLLRYALDNSGRQEVTLSEEMDVLRLYLSIEQMRFPDRLHSSIQIAPETTEARIPSLLLQPLVENAIRHGAAKKLARTTITVSSGRTNGTLTVRVIDDGNGLPTDFEAIDSCGIGLSNTRDRLRQLYGEHQSLTLANRPEGGVEVRVDLPFSTELVEEVSPV